MRKSRIFDELGTLSFYADCVIDGVGTLWLTFFAVFIGMTFDPDVVSDRVVVGVVIGGTVYGILETFGPIQWAAINPIIAMAFAITRKISVVKGKHDKVTTWISNGHVVYPYNRAFVILLLLAWTSCDQIAICRSFETPCRAYHCHNQHLFLFQKIQFHIMNVWVT